MYVDLLIDQNKEVYAVDCLIEGSILRVGALFLSEKIKTTAIRFDYNDEVIEIQIPEEELNQPFCSKTWDVAISFESIPKT